jgi:glycosyltransferase involved in cell wall biosynthesis
MAQLSPQHETLIHRPKLQSAKHVNTSMRVLYISSYMPRRCGIASFTRDLTRSINLINPPHPAKIMVMCDKLSEELAYPEEARFIVRESEWSDYQRAAEEINKSEEFDLICLQHEYGIFGGEGGEYGVRFIEMLKKPIIATLHTILPTTSPKNVENLQRVCRKAERVIVMLEAGADILHRTYKIPREKIAVVPHGVPQFTSGSVEISKKELGLQNNIVMTSINLLSSNKGIEYAIRSLPEIVEQFPNFIYLVVGQTHPVILANANGQDEYRNHLITLARKLGVQRNVVFINRYVSLKELISIVSASDFYVTPYTEPQQVTSGALAYAIGAGKVCISTPYLYANQMLGKGRGVIVPFQNSEHIAKSIISLIRNPSQKRQIEQKAHHIGKLMTWRNVGKQYLQLFNSLTF